MIRKIVVFFVFILLIMNAFAQNAVSGIVFRYGSTNRAIPEVLKDFERQTNYHFTYNSAIFEKKTPLTIPEKVYSFEQLLHIVLGTQFVYKVIGNQILISEAQPAPIKETPAVVSQQQSQQPITKQHNPHEQVRYTIIYDTIRVYDTVRVVKTERKTVMDTQRVLLQEPKKTLPKPSAFAVGVFAGVTSTVPISFGSADETNVLRHSEQNVLTHSASMLAQYRTKKLLVSAGFSYADVGYESKFTTRSYSEDPSVTFSDTLWYWRYTKLFTYYKYIGNDSIAIEVFDSTYTYKVVENPKRVEHNSDVNSHISLHYASIPCAVGYRFELGRAWSVEPFAQASLQILTLRRGVILSPEGQAVWLRTAPLRAVTYSFGAGCLLNYSVSERFLLSLKAVGVYFPSIYKPSQGFLRKALLSGSVEWGIVYKIPQR
jgi:hypothetical protein